MTRRWVFLLCGIVIVAALTAVYAQETTKAPPPPSGSGEFVYVTGTSKDGKLNAALRSAIDEASVLAGQHGADIMIEWEVDRIHGRKGGIAGFNEVSVTIRIPRSVKQ